MDEERRVKIKSIFKPDDGNPALVVKLKNDYISDFAEYNVDIYNDRSDVSQNIVVAEKDGVLFSNQTQEDKSVCQNYLLIVNKKKNRARLIPTSVANLFEVNINPDADLPDLRDYDTKVSNLTDAFGSKKSKRRHLLMQKMTVNPDACEQTLRPIISETEIDESFMIAVDDTKYLEALIPPCNRSASSPQNVYNADDLLTQNEKASLLEAAQGLIDNPPVENDSTNSYFIFSHYKLISKNIDSIVLLLYADCLVRLLKTRPKAMKEKNAWSTISPHSKIIISKLKKEFTDNKTMTPMMKHKVACFTLVSVLLACNYKIHVDLILRSLSGLDIKKLLQLCRLVGLSAGSRSANQVLTLKLPLPPLPVANKSPKKRKR